MNSVKTEKLSKGKTVSILLLVAVIVIAAVAGAVAGHGIYLRKQSAEILNYSELLAEGGLKYYYDDNLTKVNVNDAVVLPDGASLEVTKLQDESGRITKAEGDEVDLSVSRQVKAEFDVTSASGKNTKNYSLTLAPKSVVANAIEYNVADATLPDGIFTNYTGDVDYTLPVPEKIYYGMNGRKYEYNFEGWYTDENYSEESKIETIAAGSAGKLELYAKFADAAETRQDGYTYVVMGKYPQTRVTDYTLNNALLAYCSSHNYENVVFNYPEGDAAQYYVYRAVNYPNLAENGFAAGTRYVFKVEPIEWRVLKKANEVPTANEQVTLLACKVLDCSAFGKTDKWLKGQLDKFLNKYQSDIDKFDGAVRYYFNPDNIYAGPNEWSTLDSAGVGGENADNIKNSPIRSTLKDIYDGNKLDLAGGGKFSSFTQSEKDRMNERVFSIYRTFLNANMATFRDKLYLLNYGEVIDPAFGFNPDYMYNDENRKGYASDFAAAMGAFRSKEVAHAGQCTWWLRGSGPKDGVTLDPNGGNPEQGYTYRDKRLAYVKFTGYVHAYGSLKYEIRSGVRPSVNVTYPEKGVF